MAPLGTLRSAIQAALPTLDWVAAGLEDSGQSLQANLPKFAAAIGVPDADTLFPTLLNTITFELVEFSSAAPRQFLAGFNPASDSIPLPDLAPDLLEIGRISFGMAIDLDGTPPLRLYIKGGASFAGTAVTLMAEVPVGGQFPCDFIDASLVFDNLTLRPMFEKLNVPGHGFENLRLASIDISCPIPADFVNFAFSLADIWKMPLGQQNHYFSLDEITISALYLTGDEGGFSGMGRAKGHLDDIDFEIAIQYLGGDGGWALFGKAGNIPVGKVLEKFGLGTESPFADMIVDAVAFDCNTATKNFHFSFSGHTNLSDTVTASMTAEVGIYSRPGGEFEKFFSGMVAVGPVKFNLVFDQYAGSQNFIGVFENTGSANVSVVDLITPLIAVPSGLGDLNLSIKDAMLAYQSATDASGAKRTNYLFAIRTGLTINLSGLNHVPLVGQSLPAGQNLDLAFQVLTHSDGFNADAAFRKMLPKGAPVIPEQLGNTLQVLTTLRIGDLCKQIELDIAPSDAQSNSKPTQSTDLPSTPPVADAANPRKTDVQKHFGPLNIESVAVAFDKPKKRIAILVSGSLSVTGLDLAIDGLAGTFDLATREVTFGLKGLSIDFRRGELEIGGGFLNVDGDFAGKVVIKTKTFSLAALGAVAITEGQPSIFIYGFLNYPLGGPAFFFVEGLAAGFGYNRGFILPAIADVRSFPLVQDAASLASGQMLSTKPKSKDEITNQLTRLHEFIPPRNGEYFFSAGIKFSSFKLLNSFLLVTVVAGERFEIDVLGVSTYQNPPIAVPGIPSLARIEMNILGRIAPDAGFAGIQAQLTSASYIYSSLCKLAGGFAFFTWFKPSALAGDFVLSVGGYHPGFSKPAHYPDVPRLSLTYQITENIFAKGSAYFALTPTVLMAGAALEARAKIGSLEAWFNASLDFMIGWEPYHYEASLNVSIGARWTIFETELNAQVDIWGPEFSGCARVDWTIFSFDVSFGGPRVGPSPITFDRFRDQFLENDADRAAGKKLLFTRVLDGAIGSVKQGAVEIPIVNPAQFRLETSSPIPSSTASFNNSAAIADFTLSPFGIAPMDVDTVKLSMSSHAVGIRCNGQVVSHLVAKPMQQMYPPGLWHTAITVPSNAPMISAIGGFTVSAPPPDTLPSVGIKRSDLDFSLPVITAVQPSVPVRYTNQPAARQSAELQSAFESAASSRAEILRALGLEPVTLVSISPSLADAFEAPPEIVGA